MKLTHLALILALAPAVLADDKLPSLKQLAEADVKNVNWIAVNGKGTELAVCSDSHVQIRDAKTLKSTRTHRFAGRRAEFVNGDKALLVAGAMRNGIELLDRETGKLDSLNQGELDFRADASLGLLAYRGGKDAGRLHVFDLAKRKLIGRWEPESWVGSPGLRCFSAKGVLIGDCVQTVKRDGKTTIVDCLVVWKSPWDKAPTLIECSATPHSLAISADGKSIATGTERKIDLWDLEKGKVVQSTTVPLPRGRVEALAYSPDGKRLAALSSRTRRGLSDPGEAELTVYDAATLKRVATVTAHQSPGRLMVYFPDGKRIATAGRFDDRVRVWGIE